MSKTSESNVQGSSTSGGRKTAPVCPSGITLRALREYLFGVIPADESVARHVEQGCAACARRIEHLSLVEPYLRDGIDKRLAILLDEVPPRKPQETLPPSTDAGGLAETERKSLQLTVAQGLARLLVRPDHAWTLAEMWEWNNKLQSVANEAERRSLVCELQKTAQAQLRLVSEPLQQEAKAFAESLLSGLMGGDAANVPDVSDHRTENPPAFRRAFVLYLMTREWFLNPGGEPLWSIRPGSDEDVTIDLKKRPGLVVKKSTV